MEVPFCRQRLEEGENSQLHNFSCPANSEKKDEKRSSVEKLVRLRWAKVEPCVQRIAHLITSLNHTIPLYWSDVEGLYESVPIKITPGTYSCTLVVDGDTIPMDEFEVNDESDTIYIIPTEKDEGESQGSIVNDDDDPVADLLASASITGRGSNDLGKEEYPSIAGVERHSITGDNLTPDREKAAKSTGTELSPLYKELLHFQVLHGGPEWLPNGDDQSPTVSDHELDELMKTGNDRGPPPHLTSQPANPEKRSLKSPIPIRPLSNKEERMRDTLPGTQGEGTEKRGLKTGDVKGPDGHHGSQSPAASSVTYSGSSSEGSSARNSPDPDTSDGANDSDGSDALQEQSLEEAIPRDSPELQELPRPYDGTFLTRDLREEEESPQEKKPSSPIPLGFTTNQSSSRASPHSETRGGSVPGSRGSPVASDRSFDGVPSTSGVLESTQPSITSLPDPGMLQGSLRSMDEEPKSPPVSGRDRTTRTSSPASCTHSRVRKRSTEDIRSPPLSGFERTPSGSSPLGSVHSSTRSSRGQSPTLPLGSLLGQGTMHHGTTSPTATTSQARSIHSSVRSSRGQSPIASLSSLPGQGTTHAYGTTSPAAISSVHSSARSTPRGSSPARRSPTDSHPKVDEDDVLSRHLRSSRDPVDPFGQAFSHELLGSLSPRSSAHSRVSPALSQGSREGYRMTSQSLIDSFDNIRNHRTMFNEGTSRDQRMRSLERWRDDGHRRSEGDSKGMFPGHFITSSSRAFAPMNGDRTKLDENHNEERIKAIREKERLFQEKQMEFETEIRRLREVNDDLKQQLLSVEAAVSLSERDNQKSQELEATVESLNDTVRAKDYAIAQLKKRCEELEKQNQEMKNEQESLKTVNKLTYEDLNKENSVLKAKINSMQRKTYGSPMKTHTSTFTDEILNKRLREQVTQLEADKRELKQKYNKVKLELEQTKADKTLSDFRLKKARSETDLSGKFNSRHTDQSWSKTTLGLGNSQYSWSDNFESAYKVGSGTIQDSGLTNGLSTRDTHMSRRDDHVNGRPLYSTSHQRRRHSSIDDDIDVSSDTLDQDLDYRSTHAYDRQRTLSSESSNSSLLEYEYGANMRVPYQPSTYSTRDTKVELRDTRRGRRVRPHSSHAALDSDRQTTNVDLNHYRSFSHSPSRSKDYGSTYRTLDYTTSTNPLDFESKSRTRDFGSRPDRYGTKSTATTPYSTTTGYPRASPSQPFCPNVSDDVKLGMRVMVNRNGGICAHGIVKYVGTLPGREGPYVGVELDTGDGRHDGSFYGHRLFKCKPNRGIFVKLSKVLMCYPK